MFHTRLLGIMDTRNSQNTLWQSQNSSPQLNIHFSPHTDASSTSLLRPDERSGQHEYHNAKRLKRVSALGFSVAIEIALCIIVLCFMSNYSIPFFIILTSLILRVVFAGLAFWMKDSPTGTLQGNQIEQAMKIVRRRNSTACS